MVTRSDVLGGASDENQGGRTNANVTLVGAGGGAGQMERRGDGETGRRGDGGDGEMNR